MQMRSKSFLRTLVVLIVLFVIASLLFDLKEYSNTSEPADFYGTSKEVSLEEMANVANKFNLSIYLPSELPDNFELTTIYLKDGPFIAIVVYSAEGNKDYKTAELGIQITPSDSPPTYNELVSIANESEYKMALEINDWPVLIDERKFITTNEDFKKKYGDYTLLMKFWIEGMRYNIGAPTLNVATAIQLVENMSLLIL